MSSPININRSNSSSQGLQISLEGQTSAPTLPDIPSGSLGDKSSENIGIAMATQTPPADAAPSTIGQHIAAFMQSFSPLVAHEHSSSLNSSSLPRSASPSDKLRVLSPSFSEPRIPISFGSPPSVVREASLPNLASSSGVVVTTSSNTIMPSSTVVGDIEGGFVKIETASLSSSSIPQIAPVTPTITTTAPSNPLGVGTIFTASSAMNLVSNGASSGLFSSLGSFFSKKEITGSFEVELGTSIKVGVNDYEEHSPECPTDADGYLGTHFEIGTTDLSNVDQIIVQKLMLLFSEAKKRDPHQNLDTISLMSSVVSASLDTASPANSSLSTSSAPLLAKVSTANAAQSSSSLSPFAPSQQTYLQTLTSNINSTTPTSNPDALNSQMESAVEWALQARPLGYAYKGIGKLLRKITIIAQPPHDLHLTHVPLFLHSVPQLEVLTMRNHSMSSIPVFTFFISTRLTKVYLNDNKIKSLFSEVPKASLVGLIPPGTQATYTPPAPRIRRPAHAASSSESPSMQASSTVEAPPNPDPIRKTDLLEHLSSPLSYFAALDPPPVEILDLSGNQLSTIPGFIGHFRFLETLNLARNLLYSLPSEMSSIPSLTDLNIDNNYITELPPMSALRKLSWRANGIKPPLLTLNARRIVSSLANQPQLTSLDLSGNFLDQIPLSVIFIAPNLTSLSMASNAIYNISGDEVAKFVRMQSLDLSSNRLRAVPVELFGLPLQHLNISDNQLLTLPCPLNPLASTLITLNLSKNQFKLIPLNFPHQVDHLEGIFIKSSDIQQFSKLTTIDFSNNKLAELPDMFEDLGPTLTHLDVSNNLLTTLPSSAGALISLATLNLANNKLEALPTIGLLRSLETLDLSGNDALNNLPRTFVELSQLSEFTFGQVKMRRFHPHQGNIWKYDVQPIKPITDKIFIDRVPQLLSVARNSTHSLLLSAVHFLCKHTAFHSAILSSNMLYSLLSNAKCVPMEKDYDACFNAGQEKISSLMAVRHLSKNLEVREMLLAERPLITILSEHVLQQAAMKDSGADAEFYDAEGKQLGKSSSAVAKLNELGHLSDSESSPSSSPTLSRSARSSSSSIPATHWSPFTPRASRSVQLQRVQNKIRISLTGLCLDVMCYLSWSQELRDAMNDTPGLLEAVKSLKTHVDHELSERCGRTLAGLGVAPEFKENRGYRILTLDGGGTRGFTAVVMLKHLEEISGRRIHEMFDLVVGTSTGALIATLAAWTRLTMSEAVTYYREACGIIFAPRGTGVLESKYTAPVSEAPKPNNTQVAKILSLAYELEPEMLLKITRPIPKAARQALRASPATVPLLSPSAASSPKVSRPPSAVPSDGAAASTSNPGDQEANAQSEQAAHPAGISAVWTGPSPWARIGGFFGMISSRSFYDSAALEMVLKNLGDPQATMLDTAANGDLRLIFTSTEVGVFPPQTFLLRNYSYKHDSQSKYEGTSSLKMWEAMRCSTAAPAYFDSFTANGHRLADGGISTNNPTGIALQEAKAIWPDKKPDVVLSVGVGLKPTKPIAASMSSTFGAILEGCTETEQTHALIEDFLPKGVYFRLQPVNDVFDFPLDETKIEKLDAAQVALDTWLEEHTEYFRKLADALLANRKFGDEEADEHPLDKWADHEHLHQSHSSNHMHRSPYSSGHIQGHRDSFDSDEEGPSPLRPIPSKTSIMDSYSPLDDLQHWDDEN